MDAAALQDKGGKSDLPVESVRRIACDADLVAVTRDAKGNLLNLGRKHRVVSPQLKRALLARDKCCTYPSCSHEQFLEAHHVMHWADGGETSLDNTRLICNRHHRLLHEGGFTIHKNFAGEWYFRTAEGKVLPEAPVYKPVEYDSSRDEILEDPNKVKEPRVLPKAPMYKPEGYDASRDAFTRGERTMGTICCWLSTAVGFEGRPRMYNIRSNQTTQQLHRRRHPDTLSISIIPAAVQRNLPRICVWKFVF